MDLEQVWRSRYPKGVKRDIDVNIFGNIGEVFDEAVRNYRDQPAFTNMGRSVTYAELDKLSDHFGAYLQKELGLQRGDRIALQMPNILQFPIALYGAIKAGLVVVNTNPLYTQREMKHQFKDSGAKAIVILANFCDKLEAVLSETEIKHVIVTELGDMLGFPKSLLVNTVVKHVKKMVPAYSLPQALSLKSVLAKGRQRNLTRPKVTHTDIAFLQYTGGTTGVAKAAVLSHGNVVSNMLQVGEWIKPKVADNEVVIAPLPLYHIFALIVNCLALLQKGANNILITNPRDIPGFIKELKTHPFTVFIGLNTLFNALMNDLEFRNVDFSKLKLSVGGGMALQRPVVEKWQALTQSVLVEGYGLTEASPVVSCNPIDGSDQIGTIGLPVPNTQIRIVNESGDELAVGEEGELVCLGPQVMQGYWQREDETKKVMTNDGWLKTGDIARINQDGFIQIVDRKKDMILVSGFNVFPNEIEEVLAKHDDITEAAAIGVPDEKSGEVVKVFVVKKNPSLEEKEIKAYCKEHLTAYKVPKHIEFREELPKTPVGKILRRALR